MGIDHREDSERFMVCELLVPGCFEEARFNTVDLSEASEIGDGELVRRDADDGSVGLVQRVDVVDAAAKKNLEFQVQVGIFCIPWSRNVSKRSCVCMVKGLWVLVRQCLAEVSCWGWRRTWRSKPTTKSRMPAEINVTLRMLLVCD
jgi:hypothetical protein